MRFGKASAMALGAVLAVAATTGTAGVANAATPSAVASQSVAGVQVSGLPQMASKAALTEYVATHATSVTTDGSTGELLSVGAVSNVSAKISERNVCGSGDAYWAAYKTPYTNNCFYGSAGTYLFANGGTGTISHTFRTGSHTARGARLSGSKTLRSVKQAPGSITTLTSNAKVRGAQIF